MRNRTVAIVVYLLLQCVVAYVLPSILLNAPWPSFDGVGEQLVSWEYVSIAAPVVLFVLCLQGGLVSPMTTGLKGELRDQSKGPGTPRIVAAAMALASVICVPIGYAVMALGQSFMWIQIPGLDYQIVPMLTLLGAIIVAAALVPMLRERWKRGIPIRTSILVAGLIAGLLIAVVVGAIIQIILLMTTYGGGNIIGYCMLAAPVAGWLIATPLLFAYVRKSDQVEPMDRVITLIFRGTAIEAVALLPLDVMVRRQRGCYCFEPSFWSLLMIICVGVVALGPMLIFIAGRKNRRAITGRCTGCGYDLAGLAAAVCPECGRPIPAAQTPAA